MAGRRAQSARRPAARSQHFLRDKELAAQLVDGACVGAGDLALELGAGSGLLTAELARVADHVLAVELDPEWAARLRGRWRNVEVIEADATDFQLPNEPFRVVSNLPFHRTTDLLHLLFDDPLTPLLRADLVVQWGVAVKRALPWPSSLNGVIWSAFYEISVSRRLPRTAFDPPPAVDAGVLVFRRRSEPLIPPSAVTGYRRFVALGFRRGLRAAAHPRSLKSVAERGVTPRDLDAHQWAALFLCQPQPGSRVRRGS